MKNDKLLPKDKKQMILNYLEKNIPKTESEISKALLINVKQTSYYLENFCSEKRIIRTLIDNVYHYFFNHFHGININELDITTKIEMEYLIQLIQNLNLNAKKS